MATPNGGYAKRPLWQWILLYVVIAVIVYGVAYYIISGSGNTPYNTNTAYNAPTNQAATNTTSNTPSSSTTNTPTQAGTSTGTYTYNGLTYDQARALVSYRFQFDNKCNGSTSPTSFGELNVKQGDQIMLENHGDASQVLALGNDSHTVPAGGFVVVKAPKVTKATGLYITCNGGGAGNIFVNP